MGQIIVFREVGLPDFELGRDGKLVLVRRLYPSQCVQVQSIFDSRLQGVERDPQGSRGGVVGRHQEVRKVSSKSPHLQFVEGKASDEEDRIFQDPVRNDGAHVVPGISNVKAVDDVLQSLSFVLKVNHVRLGEHRAPAGHVGRFDTLEPEGDEIRQDPVDLIPGAVFFRRVD